MQVRRATLADFRTIRRDLSKRLNVENAIVLHTFHFDPADGVRQAVKRGTAETYLKEGRPVGLLSWSIDDAIIHTGFVATDEFFSRSPSSLRFCRRRIQEVQKKLGLTVRSSTLSDHPKLSDWYKMLGFVEIPAWPHRVFELRSGTS